MNKLYFNIWVVTFQFMLIPLLINTSIEIELISARFGGSQGDNCKWTFDKDTRGLRRCCDGKFNLTN